MLGKTLNKVKWNKPTSYWLKQYTDGFVMGSNGLLWGSNKKL